MGRFGKRWRKIKTAKCLQSVASKWEILDCGGKAERDAALEKDKPGWFASESAVAAALRLGRLPAQSKKFLPSFSAFR